jgi:hypothetical protein
MQAPSGGLSYVQDQRPGAATGLFLIGPNCPEYDNLTRRGTEDRTGDTAIRVRDTHSLVSLEGLGTKTLYLPA